MCLFVPYFISYVSAKYYSNWFTVGRVTRYRKNKKGELTFETQCSWIKLKCNAQYVYTQ